MSSNTSSSSSGSIATHGNGIIIYERVVDANDEAIRFDQLTDSEILGVLNENLNCTGIYTGDYDDYLYFNGDYYDSHLKANYMKENQKSMRYNLLTFNCADAACDVLMASLDSDSKLYKGIKKIRDRHIHPGIMHKKLKTLLN